MRLMALQALHICCWRTAGNSFSGTALRCMGLCGFDQSQTLLNVIIILDYLVPKDSDKR